MKHWSSRQSNAYRCWIVIAHLNAEREPVYPIRHHLPSSPLRNTGHTDCIEMGCFSTKAEKENDEERSRREANKRIEKQLQKDKQTYRATHRLLLLGNQVVLIVSMSYLVSRVHLCCTYCSCSASRHNVMRSVIDCLLLIIMFKHSLVGVVVMYR